MGASKKAEGDLFGPGEQSTPDASGVGFRLEESCDCGISGLLGKQLEWNAVFVRRFSEGRESLKKPVGPFDVAAADGESEVAEFDVREFACNEFDLACAVCSLRFEEQR